jgi:outer membrane immunogenic protein
MGITTYLAGGEGVMLDRVSIPRLLPMKKLLVAGIAAAAFCGASALAADLPLKAPAYAAPAPMLNWTGCYFGANTGYAWAHTGLVETSVNGIPETFDRGSQTDRGWAYGGQIGCDYQFNNNWVAGIRGMWDGSNITGSRAVGPGDFVAGTDHVRIDSFATLVGKLGYLLNPTLQLYGLGGVAWVHNHYFGTDPSFGEISSANQSRTGYDVGVGLSWMFARNWDLWVEYDYMGFETKNVTFNGEGVNSGLLLGVDVKQNVSKVLVGINFRVGDLVGKAPVSTKY